MPGIIASGVADSVDVICVLSVDVKFTCPKDDVSVPVMLVESDPVINAVITAELVSALEITVLSLLEMFDPPEICTSEVSEDEISVVSVPGKSATG